MEELWQPVELEDYQGYSISNFGNVNGPKGKLKLTIDSHGYPCVVLCKKGKRKHIRVHQLVASAFIPKLEGKSEINHINGNKTDNRVENLEWCTRSENLTHAWAMGLVSFTENMRHAVTKTILAEVEKQEKAVACFLGDKLVGSYKSASEAARAVKGSQAHISNCCNGKRHTHKGLTWRWLNP